MFKENPRIGIVHKGSENVQQSESVLESAFVSKTQTITLARRESRNNEETGAGRILVKDKEKILEMKTQMFFYIYWIYTKFMNLSF